MPANDSAVAVSPRRASGHGAASAATASASRIAARPAVPMLLQFAAVKAAAAATTSKPPTASSRLAAMRGDISRGRVGPTSAAAELADPGRMSAEPGHQVGIGDVGDAEVGGTPPTPDAEVGTLPAPAAEVGMRPTSDAGIGTLPAADAGAAAARSGPGPTSGEGRRSGGTTADSAGVCSAGRSAAAASRCRHSSISSVPRRWISQRRPPASAVEI